MVRRREAVTGVLLVGGLSRRFGSPKALARLGGERLAERAHAVLGEAFETVLVVGKAADELPLPFPLVDDGSDVRAPIVGVAAGLANAPTDLAVFLPTDVPWITAQSLAALADGAEEAEVAVPQTGPLPGAYRRSALAVLERRIDAGRLALRDALTELEVRVVELDQHELANVNTLADLRRRR